MSARLDLCGAPLARFHFPPLRPEDGENPVEPSAAETADAGGGEARPAEPDRGEAAAAEAVAARAEEQYAAARAEGFQHGLEEGRREGYEAGFSEGVKAGEESLAAHGRQLAAIAATLGGPLTALERPIEEAVIALALELARCLIGGEVKRSHAFLVRLIREAIGKVPLEMGTPRVLLNPGDLDLLRRLAPEIESGNATLVGDPSIEAGGCLVVADGEDRPTRDRRWHPRGAEGTAQVDLTLASRWREVMLALFDGEDE